MKKLSKRLTYANVMSSIAVFLVLGGATALAAGLAKNSVGSKQLKKNAVTTAKIKNNAVTTSKIKNGAISGAKINLSTLGTVPSADKAKTADTAGSANSANTANSAKSAETADKTKQVANIFYTAKEPSGPQTILDLGGLKITAECPNDGSESVQLVATTSVNHSFIDFFTPQDGDYEANEDFNVGEEFDADDGHNEATFTDIYSLHYAQPGGVNVTVELRDVDPEVSPVFPGTSREADCYVGGYAISQ